MDARARRGEFSRKLAAAWGVPATRLRVPLSAAPLHAWAAPRAVDFLGTSTLNWTAWLPSSAPVAAQAARLLDLRGADAAFLLTKLVPARPPAPDDEVREVTGAAREALADSLAGRALSLMLRDEVAGEARRPLFRAAADARGKLAAAQAVYVLGDPVDPRAVAGGG